MLVARKMVVDAVMEVVAIRSDMAVEGFMWQGCMMGFRLLSSTT